MLGRARAGSPALNSGSCSSFTRSIGTPTAVAATCSTMAPVPCPASLTLAVVAENCSAPLAAASSLVRVSTAFAGAPKNLPRIVLCHAPDRGPDVARRGADLVLSGDAVEVLEALSIRRPLDQAIAPDVAWMVDGLATQFDATPR